MRLFTCVALMLVAACQGSRPGGDTTATAASARDTLSRAAVHDTVAREIYIDSVHATNPIVVFGRARTFENTVQLRVRDSAGVLLGESFTTSVGEMGNHNPFVAELRLARDPGSRVTVEVFEYSANDGSVRSLVTRAVRYPSGSVRPRSP